MNDWNERSYQYAVVDIGANSVRMNIYDIDTADGSFSVSASARSMLGLAAYVKDGALTPDGCVRRFCRFCDRIAARTFQQRENLSFHQRKARNRHRNHQRRNGGGL